MTTEPQLERMAKAIAGEHRPTFCATCRHVHRENKGDHWIKWQCVAAKNFQVSYVTGKLDPPYRFCRFINYGDCSMWEEGRNFLSPDVLEHNEAKGTHTLKAEKPDGNQG